MEVQWKYNGENTQLASLFHYGRMSSALSWNTQNLKWRSGRFETSCFAQFFIVPVNPRLGASPMMCLHILALGIVTFWIIHYERDILSITWRDGPLLQIQEAGRPCICLIRLYWFSTIRATKPLWLTLFINWKCGRSDSVVKADTTRRLEGPRW